MQSMTLISTRFNYTKKKKEESKRRLEDFPGGPVLKSSPVSAGDTGSVSGPGRFHTPWGN